MDILVYIRSGENEELRYAIRTWCENLNFNRLCVVGGPKPQWLLPDVYLPNAPKYSKMSQALSNLQLATSSGQISDDLLILMDDVFVIQKTDWDINYNRHTLIDQYDASIARFGKNDYAKQLLFTNDWLISYGIEAPISFEEHAPFRCNKKLLAKTLSLVDDSDPEQLLWRSVYGNINHIPTEYRKDIKKMDGGERFNYSESVISTSQASFRGACGRGIRSFFPDASPYEGIL